MDLSVFFFTLMGRVCGLMICLHHIGDLLKKDSQLPMTSFDALPPNLSAFLSDCWSLSTTHSINRLSGKMLLVDAVGIAILGFVVH